MKSTIRKGVVTKVIHAGHCGVIEDASKREFYFSVNQCCSGEMPALLSEVTFVKDADFKSTDVAILIEPLKIAKAA